MSIKTIGVGLAHRPKLSYDEFEALADAAIRAMFWVDGRVEDTQSAKVLMDANEVIATRGFKAQLRRELKRANFVVWPKGKKWA